MATLQVKPSIVNQIRDAYLKKMKEKVEAKSNTQFIIRKDGILMIGNHLCVPDVRELRRQIMNEAYTAPYATHPETTKMY